ncbi:diuretic hormone 41 isoform X2 [Leguminivora glycinivorella]|uniref:diuretic hormone 41 isoform X2 n=1 Tax=Leguminivora glycinivorella TaxID=1035111 RepID=UPI00200C837D|nr:diuretic hormone 41 isoform X2 [Leguminivora glycinivorella]
MMWWAMWCAAVVAGAAAAPAADALAPLALDLPQIDALTPDDESMSYAGPAGRYAASAPLVYLLPDMPRDAQEWSGRSKRRAPTLSIDLPMAVLRHKLGLEQARKAQALRAAENRSFLNEIGKRGFQWDSSLESQKYYY